MPRSTRKASNGPATAPSRSGGRSALAELGVRAPHHERATDDVAVPAQVLVVECTTTSAPNARGCCRYGVAKVLSTTNRAPASRLGRRGPRCRRCRAVGWSASRTRSPAWTAAPRRARHPGRTNAPGCARCPTGPAPGPPAGTSRRTHRRVAARGHQARRRPAAGCPTRPGRSRTPILAPHPPTRPAPLPGPYASGWRCGCTRIRPAGRPRRPACTWTSRRSGRSPHRSANQAPARRGWRAC